MFLGSPQVPRGQCRSLHRFDAPESRQLDDIAVIAGTEELQRLQRLCEPRCGLWFARLSLHQLQGLQRLRGVSRALRGSRLDPYQRPDGGQKGFDGAGCPHGVLRGCIALDAALQTPRGAEQRLHAGALHRRLPRMRGERVDRSPSPLLCHPTLQIATQEKLWAGALQLIKSQSR